MGQLHHLNVGCADASVIVTNNGTFLVDCHNIGDHAHLLPQHKHLRGAFITHQHFDHYSGLGYLRDNGYTIEHLIYSPYQRRLGDASVTLEEWKQFNDYVNCFHGKGTQLHCPYRQGNLTEPWWATNGLKFFVLGPAKSIADRESRELHDACLVVHAEIGNRRCIFTGDASDANLEWIAANTTNYCNDILHASHHGSIEGASLDFVKGCKARYTVVSTQSGVHSNVPHPTAMARYRSNTNEKVYRTDQDDSLTWNF